MGRADFSRRKESCRNAVTHGFQVLGDDIKAESEVPRDVLEEGPLGLTLPENASHIWPEVTWIGVASALAGHAEGLAWIPAMNEVNAASPRLAVEGLEVSPDGSAVKDSIRHPGEQDVLRVRGVLDVADGAVVGLGKVESEVKASDASTE